MYITIRQLANKINNLERFSPEELSKPVFNEQCKQWIADDYHCSEIWGTKQTEEEMYTELVEMQKCKNPEDFSPDPALYKECAAYWNQLAEMYPN